MDCDRGRTMNRQMEAPSTDLGVKGVPNPGGSQSKGDACPENRIECQWEKGGIAKLGHASRC